MLIDPFFWEFKAVRLIIVEEGQDALAQRQGSIRARDLGLGWDYPVGQGQSLVLCSIFFTLPLSRKAL